MKCLYCDSKMEKSKTSYTINRKGYHLFLVEIPVYVCTKCKEKHFEEREVGYIQRLIRRLESDVRSLQAV